MSQSHLVRDRKSLVSLSLWRTEATCSMAKTALKNGGLKSRIKTSILKMRVQNMTKTGVVKEEAKYHLSCTPNENLLALVSYRMKNYSK